MAFPWKIISQVDLANNKTVDDMQLSIDLAIAGYAASYFPQGRVTGRLMQKEQAQSQKSRWEHGHLSLIFSQTPRLLIASFSQRRLDLLALALELSVPPLSLLILLWVVALGVMLVAGFLSISWLPMIILSVSGLFLIFSVLGSWAKFGREEIPISVLVMIPLYLIWKIPVYFAFFIRGQSQAEWIRTERD